MQRGVTQRWKGWVVAVAALGASGLAILGTDAAHAASSTTSTSTANPITVPATDVASSKWSGQAAITRLGTRLPSVARANGLSEAELRSHFRTDATLQVDATDRLLYVEPTLAQAGTPAGAAVPSLFESTIDAATAFALHSNPGANRVIFLDFDGHTLSGTAWNNSTGGDCYAEPFDSDSNPTSFSTSERNNIINTWRRVAEDFAPFDVDVTTEDPGYAAINRASSSDTQFGSRLIVTNSKTACPNGKTLYSSVCSAGCGGIAYVGVYDNTGSNHDYYQPAIVFQNGVSSNPKYVAEAASHEVGHNIGLSHDGTSSVGYYQGHGSWAPIMGVGYYKAISQWSKGEYTGANNKQDDFAVAVSNGLPIRTDDHGNTAAAATALSGNPATADGIIESASDIDAFVIAVSAGPATFSVDPAPVSPDVDLQITVLDVTGDVLATADPASGSTGYDSPTGLGASVSLDLAAGTYTVLVQGVGYGDPLSTGYSAYGSTGNYRLAVSPTGTTGQAPIAVAIASTTSGQAPVAVNFTGSGSTDPENAALTYSWTFGDGGTSTAADPAHTYTTAGTYTARLTVTDDQNLTSTSSVTITVTAPVRRIDVSAMTISGTRNASTSRTSVNTTVTISDQSGAPASAASVTAKWYFGATLYRTVSTKTTTSGVATLSFSNVKVARGTVVKLCVTSVALTGTVWDTTVYSPTTATDCITWTAP